MAQPLKRGSVWRLTDLHIHCPSMTNKAANQFGNATDDKVWSAYFDTLSKSEVDIFGITDYFSINGYLEFIDRAKRIQPDLLERKLFFPNIEFRVPHSVNKDNQEVNIHVIFNNEPTTIAKIQKFLSKLQIKRKDLETGAELCCIDEDIKQAGGYDSVCVDYDSVVTTLKTTFGDEENRSYIILAAVNGYGSARPDGSSKRKDKLSENIDSICDACFGKAENVDWYLNEERFVNSKVIPVISGSDAHSFGDLENAYSKGEPSLTWIKADKSFLGLKQILDFPKERVSISQSKPTYSHPQIVSITIFSKNNKHCLFSLNEIVIPISSNLTCLIGHPSIGKSTYAEVIAYIFGILPNLLSPSLSKVDNLKKVDPDLEVELVVSIGNSTRTIRSRVSDLKKTTFSVEYIDQGYIDWATRDASRINELLKKKIDNQTVQLSKLWYEIETDKNSLINTRNSYLNKHKYQEKLVELQIKLKTIEDKLKVSKSTKYASLLKRAEDASKRKKELNDLLQKITDYKLAFQELSEKISNINLDAESISKKFKSVDTSKVKFLSISSEDLNQLSTLSKSITESEEMINANEEWKSVNLEMTTLAREENIKFSDDYFETVRGDLETTRGEIEKLEAKLQACTQIYTDTLQQINAIKAKFQVWNTENGLFIQEFNSDLDQVHVVYENDDFEKWFTSIVRNDVLVTWKDFAPESEKIDNFRQISEDEVKKVFDAVAEMAKKQGKSVIDVLEELLKNKVKPDNLDSVAVQWLFGEKSKLITDFLYLKILEYTEKGIHQVYFGSKNIVSGELSSTERCGALLELMINKGDSPLIVDQPEDDLGSTYITKQLIPMILKAKEKRQLIFVSHNPNTVVLSDSELVIAFDREKENLDTIKVSFGSIESGGMKDTICRLVEGGKDAFRKRSRAYSLRK